jgi:flagellar hook assembly protein FlgD
MRNILPITWLLALPLLLTGINVAAQTKQAEKQDNLQQQKVNFFTENLQLTSAESGRFWPVYNDYQNRRDKITRDRNTLLKYFESNKNNLTDAEANELIGKYLAFQQEETRLLESYTKKFQEFLPAKKVMRIYIVELEFKKWLLENLRQNKTQASPRQ